MSNDLFTSSILRQKAEKRKCRNIAKAPDEVQIEIYRDTLTDMEKYLDVGDTRKLKQKSLGIIRDDVLDTINGIRDLRSQPLPRTTKSLDGALDSLRKAKISLQVSMGMFDVSGQLKEGKSKVFFKELEIARKHIEDTLKQFKK